MQTIALSETAVAVLRFRVKGWRFPVRERDRDAFSELVEAGIMEPDGTDFRFTEGGWRGETSCSPPPLRRPPQPGAATAGSARASLRGQANAGAAPGGRS